MTATALELHALADHPELEPHWNNVEGAWPAFMEKDPVAVRYTAARHLYPQLHLLGLLDGEPVARVHAVPLRWQRVDDLPVTGRDAVLSDAVDRPIDDLTGVSLIEIRLRPGLRGQGLSHEVLTQTCAHLRSLGVEHLVGPVRPNGKAEHPTASIEEYAARTRGDGLPEDAWLRVHVRAGGVIVKVAFLSMVIPGTVGQWREWTGLPFDRSGNVVVPGALVPVHVDVAQGHAVYVEPNVWVHHHLNGR